MTFNSCHRQGLKVRIRSGKINEPGLCNYGSRPQQEWQIVRGQSNLQDQSKERGTTDRCNPPPEGTCNSIGLRACWAQKLHRGSPRCRSHWRSGACTSGAGSWPSFPWMSTARPRHFIVRVRKRQKGGPKRISVTRVYKMGYLQTLLRK